MTLFRTAAYAALGALATPWRVLNKGGIRILAYHGVPDRDRFRKQLAHLVDHYSPIAGLESREFVKPPVWVTFDDGDPSIVDVALPVLGEFEVAATAFICPGVIDTEEPFWWQVVESAVAEGATVGGDWIVSAELSTLKTLPDEQRRERVKEIRRALENQAGEPLRTRQLTTDEIRKWLAAGHSIGNHTWDHPVLSNCSPDEQARQVIDADRWLVEREMSTDLFAYPNGSWSSASENALAESGYSVGLLFDHQVASPSPGLAMSRIRVNGTDPLPEFTAKVSGVHSALHHRKG